MKNKWLNRLASGLPKYLFVFSLCLLSLLYGLEAANREIFPQPQIKEAKSAVKALIQVFNAKASTGKVSTIESPTVSTVDNHAGLDDGALILVSGGEGYLANYNPKGGCLAWLMNRKGEIQHTWKYDPGLWNDLEHVDTVPGLSTAYPFGVHMLPDGGLIATFHGLHTWPFAIGIARLDKDSNLIWKKECLAHHWFVITPDQKIITPTLRVLEGPQPIGLTRGRIRGENNKVYEDMISVMSLEGEVLQEISMLDVMHDSGLIGLYQGTFLKQPHFNSPDVDSSDPLHLNCVELVGEQVAAAHDWLNADDFLVSFRNINTIAIIDRATLRIKWRNVGTTLRQHSPRFIDDHNILVFDNMGGDASLGGTRLVTIGLKDRMSKRIFPNPKYPPGKAVFTPNCGYLDKNHDQSAVLMAVARQDRLLEVDLQSGKVQWEYHFADDTGQKRPLFTAKYCYDAAFEMNQVQKKE